MIETVVLLSFIFVLKNGIISKISYCISGDKELSDKSKLIFALVLCIVVPSFTIYALTQNNPVPDKQGDDYTDLELIAINFLKSGPTFSFDGITESINIVEKYTMESYPEQHVIIISFNTTHAGWGNREGTFIAQVITPHIIKITIVENAVVEAIIDDKWDELNQEQIIPEELLGPEKARNAAIRYLFQNYPELGNLTVPSIWISEMHTPIGLVGASTLRYLSEGWNITVRNAVVQYPDYQIDIEYSGEQNFYWSGTVYHTGEIAVSIYEIK